MVFRANLSTFFKKLTRIFWPDIGLNFAYLLEELNDSSLTPGIRSALWGMRALGGQIVEQKEQEHMEPQRDKSATPDPIPEQQKRKTRFQIVKLEERIAPNKGGGYPGHTHLTHCKTSS